MDAAVFGLIVADVIAEPLNLRQPPAPGGLQPLHSISLTTGGNVCNSGLAFSRLGMRAAAAGCVGNDVLGKAVLDGLKQGGVETTHVVVTDQAQTSASIVAVEPGGERCFFYTAGASDLLDAKMFRSGFTLFRQCAILQIGYFGMLPRLTPALPGLLQELKTIAPHLRIALDTINPPASSELLNPLLPHVDVFAPSRPEAIALTGETEPARMAAVLRRRMGRGLIGIKLDAQGCYLDDGSASLLVPPYPVNVVDATGAGDTWFAGLLCGLSRGMPLEHAGRLANRVAADCCTALGASAGLRPFAETVSRL